MEIHQQKSPDQAGLFAKAACKPGVVGSGRSRFHHNVLTLRSALLHELHHAMRLGEQGVITADTNILTRPELGATLTNDDGAGLNLLATVHFYAKSFRF